MQTCIVAGLRTRPSGLVVPDHALAAGRFSGFKPDLEGVQQARSPLVPNLDHLQNLRQTREMLRLMPPEAVLTMMVFHDRLNLFEVVALAKETGKLMVPHGAIDRILTETEYDLPGVITGTMIIFGAPNKPFSDTVVFDNGDHIEFSVPVQLRGKRNCALVVEHPDFEIVPLGVRGGHQFVVPDESKLHLLANFPKENCWYGSYDPLFIVPFGVGTKEEHFNSRYLHAQGQGFGGTRKGAFIGPIVRDSQSTAKGCSVNIKMNHRPSYGCHGVALV